MTSVLSIASPQMISLFQSRLLFIPLWQERRDQPCTLGWFSSSSMRPSTHLELWTGSSGNEMRAGHQEVLVKLVRYNWWDGDFDSRKNNAAQLSKSCRYQHTYPFKMFTTKSLSSQEVIWETLGNLSQQPRTNVTWILLHLKTTTKGVWIL